MVAVDRERLGECGTAAVNHYRAGRIGFLRHLISLGEDRLPHIEAAAVPGVDVVDLVLDGPNKYAGVVALAFDPCRQVVEPVFAEFRK